MKYDVFISYRIEGGYETAKHLNDLLVRDGYRVSFDIDTLRNGDFDTQLLERIEQCKDFILIVDAHAFDRTLDPTFDPQKDWVHRELAHALKYKKNIIPVFLYNVSTFPEGLPNDISEVTTKHGPEYNKYYFNDFYIKLKEDFLLTKRHSNRWLFFFILLLILLCVGGVFAYRYYEKYSKYIISLVDQTINSDTEAGIAILCEALPNHMHKSYEFSILREADEIEVTKLDSGYELFNDDCIAIKDDASIIATSEYGKSIKLIDILSAQITRIESEHLPLSGSRAIAFNPTKNNLALLCYHYPSFKVVVYDLESNEEVYYQDLSLRGLGLGLDNIKYKNDYIVLYGYEGLVLIDVNRGIIYDDIIEKDVENVEFNATGDKIYILLDNQILLFDINEMCVTRRAPIVADARSVMAISNDNHYLYVGSNKHILKIHSSTMAQLKELKIPQNICSIKFLK